MAAKVRSLSAALVGLPNVGKSLVFNILTRSKVPSENFCFCTISPHTGKMAVYDKNLERIRKFYAGRPVPCEVNLTDVAGLIRGAASGAGLGNRFLATIREADAIVHLVRCFRDPQVVSDSGVTAKSAQAELGRRDPVGEIEIIQSELSLSDLEAVERLKEKRKISLPLYTWVTDRLNACFAPISNIEVDALPVDLRTELSTLKLLSTKPVLYLCNLDEDQATAYVEYEAYFTNTRAFSPEQQAQIEKKIEAHEGLRYVLDVHRWCAQTYARTAFLAGAVERDMMDFDDFAQEQKYRSELSELGIHIPDRNVFSRAILDLLKLTSFYTAGDLEIRSWLIPQSCTARMAASKIHTDIANALVKAHSFSIQDLEAYGSEAAVKAAGRLRLDGPDQPVRPDHIYKFLHTAK